MIANSTQWQKRGQHGEYWSNDTSYLVPLIALLSFKLIIKQRHNDIFVFAVVLFKYKKQLIFWHRISSQLSHGWEIYTLLSLIIFIYFIYTQVQMNDKLSTAIELYATRNKVIVRALHGENGQGKWMKKMGINQFKTIEQKTLLASNYNVSYVTYKVTNDQCISQQERFYS